MTIHTFHLAALSPLMTARAMVRPVGPERVTGLRHAEAMTTMRLGAPVFSPARLQLRQFAMFAAWESEAALDDFLGKHPLGKRLGAGWHVRLQFLRRWGRVGAFGELPARDGTWGQDEPVVAVTLARIKLPQLPRFIRWGRPVERLVRDDPATTLALAAVRPPRTVSTFTVWRSVEAMTQMVRGAGPVEQPERHAAAMRERDRKDFHHEFATFRFRCLSEHGSFNGTSSYVPK